MTHLPVRSTGVITPLRRWPALLLLGGVVLCALVVVGLAPRGAKPLVAGFAVLLTALLALTLRRVSRISREAALAVHSAVEGARRDADEARDAMAAAVRHLSGTMIPWAVERFRSGKSAEAIARSVAQAEPAEALPGDVRAAVIFAVLDAEERARRAALELSMVDRAARRLVEADLPQAVRELRRGSGVEEVFAGYHAARGDGLPAWFDAWFRVAVAAESRGMVRRESMMLAFVALGQRMQSRLHRVLRRLADLQEEHHADAKVFALLLELDHLVSQAGRLADGIVVVGGGRPGQQWSGPLKLFSVLRGAMSRMSDYQRVELGEEGVVQVGVDGAAGHSLIHLFAELLQNAVQFSPPGSTVRVSTEEAHHGVVVHIDDAGIGMTAERARWAQEVLAGTRVVSVEDLGETPQFGLAVVSLLARPLGIEVELTRSGRGGVRAQVLLPLGLLTRSPQVAVDLEPAPAGGLARAHPAGLAPAGAKGLAADVEGSGSEALVEGVTEHGLPRRRLEAADAAGRASLPAGSEVSVVTEEQRRAAWAAWGRAHDAGSGGLSAGPEAGQEEGPW